jgi:hypothetical protein
MDAEEEGEEDEDEADRRRPSAHGRRRDNKMVRRIIQVRVVIWYIRIICRCILRLPAACYRLCRMLYVCDV